MRTMCDSDGEPQLALAKKFVSGFFCKILWKTWKNCLANPIQLDQGQRFGKENLIGLSAKKPRLEARLKVNVKTVQSCLTLCDPMDCTVHGILQARILEWVAYPFSRGSSQPRGQTQVSCIAGELLTSWATREVWYDENSLNTTPKARSMKEVIDKLHFITIKNFCTAKASIKRMRR